MPYCAPSRATLYAVLCAKWPDIGLDMEVVGQEGLHRESPTRNHAMAWGDTARGDAAPNFGAAMVVRCGAPRARARAHSVQSKLLVAPCEPLLVGHSVQSKRLMTWEARVE